jgi:hypothetical protein
VRQFGHARPDALAIPEDDMDKLLLTPTEAATALGIGRSKVYELMQTGQLQSVHSAPADASPPKHSTASSSGCAQPADSPQIRTRL